MQNEEWREIPETNGLYEVSNCGRVRSWARTKPVILKGYLDKDGYRLVRLCVEGQRKGVGVHRLVLLAFVGDSDLQGNHLNGIKDDNRLDNLEYATQSRNIQHAMTTLGHFKGEKNSGAKLVAAQVVEMRRLRSEGVPVRQLAEQFSVSRSLVDAICNGQYWTGL